MTPFYDTVLVRVTGAATACGIAWSSFLGYVHDIFSLVAVVAATVYSVYMSYDLWDRRRKRSK